GASMLLIRLVLRTNAGRRHTAHLPFFFILIVSNSGGLLTPFADPPLFLGYLRGVQFAWTLRLFPVWVVTKVWLLLVFYVLDCHAYARETTTDVQRDKLETEAVHLVGWRSVPLLFAVVGAIFLPAPLREIVMLGLSALAYFGAARTALDANAFGFGPIVEV